MIRINRYYLSDKTLGLLTAGDFHCYTLEPPWRDNQKNISCIPEGLYKLKKRWSPRFGWHYWVLDVPDRSWILIHTGNYIADTKGCILPGNRLINGGVGNSLATKHKLLRLNLTEIEIRGC